MTRLQRRHNAHESTTIDPDWRRYVTPRLRYSKERHTKQTRRIQRCKFPAINQQGFINWA